MAARRTMRSLLITAFTRTGCASSEAAARKQQNAVHSGKKIEAKPESPAKERGQFKQIGKLQMELEWLIKYPSSCDFREQQKFGKYKPP